MHSKKHRKTLHQQAHDKLASMLHPGESKRDARIAGTDSGKIYSYATYHTYTQQANDFCSYVRRTDPSCSTLSEARKYVNDWLQDKSDRGLSAWTVHTAAAAVNKVYGIPYDSPDRFCTPQRRREDAQRSRGERVRDAHFSSTNNAELIDFCRGTGLRRSELQNLRGKDLLTRDDVEMMRGSANRTERTLAEDAVLCGQKSDYFVYVRNGKGGRPRLAPIIGKDAERIAGRIRDTLPDAKVWQHVHTSADIHGYRAEYATQMYKMYAREISDIPYDKVNAGTGKRYQSDVYCCRKDEAGRKLDKAAMLICSKALGHNRISVVADNYIRGL